MFDETIHVARSKEKAGGCLHGRKEEEEEKKRVFWSFFNFLWGAFVQKWGALILGAFIRGEHWQVQFNFC